MSRERTERRKMWRKFEKQQRKEKVPSMGLPAQVPAEPDRINVYTCQNASCGHERVTIDIHEGVTPFMMTCPKCGGVGYSNMYNPANKGRTPAYEWFMPASLKEVRSWEFDHVMMGGLVIREIIKKDN